MNKRPPIWLLPNLLSLDAPLVAMIWMWMLACSMRVQYVEGSSYFILAAAVWCIYVLDRIRDVSCGVHPIQGEAPWRHRFHWQMRWPLLIAVALAVCFSIYAVLFVLSRELLSVGIVGGVMVLLYLFISRIDKADVAYGKNFMAGMTFAFGVAAPIVIYSQSMPYVLSDVIEPIKTGIEIGGVEGFLLGAKYSLLTFVQMVVASIQLILGTVHVVLFGLLCVMNITAIDLWERSRRSDNMEVKEASELSLTAGLIALVGGAVISAAYFVDDYGAPLCYAVMVSAALLQIINRHRAKFSVDALRVLADVALVVPAPLFLLWE